MDESIFWIPLFNSDIPFFLITAAHSTFWKVLLRFLCNLSAESQHWTTIVVAETHRMPKMSTGVDILIEVWNYDEYHIYWRRDLP